jgi:cellulose synthase (UDP-forming)
MMRRGFPTIALNDLVASPGAAPTTDRGTPRTELRQALPLSPRARRTTLKWAIAVGVISSAVYFGWWVEADRLLHPVLAVAFVLAAVYATAQIYFAWYVYAAIEAAESPPPPPGLTVDVFVPVYDEALELVEKSLRAAVAMRYPHRTHLLDDAQDPAFAALAGRLGVGYLTRDGHKDAKAGNVNAALAQTDGEFVTVFDVDHIPAPDFLDAVLGAFGDPQVGCVQGAVAFHNQDDSLVARATIEQAYDVYGPTSMGMHGCGAGPVWGSHTTFRRAALEDIGGYAPGLAEDLHTSLRLHAAGWRSIYVSGIHASGLVPSDLRAFTMQQRKWSRGVFGLLMEVYPRLLPRLTWRQRIAYLVRGTYYLIGPLFALHAFLAVYTLLVGSRATVDGFAEYLLRALPLVASVVSVRALANLFWNVQRDAVGLKWRGYTLAFALWPVYTGTFVRALLRIPLPHIATPKRRIAEAHPRLVLAQLVTIALLGLGLGARLGDAMSMNLAVTMLFALAAIAIQGYAVMAALRP